MKSLHIAAIVGALALAVTTISVFAASDVLVPQDNPASKAPGYLGLAPADPDQQPTGDVPKSTNDSVYQPSLPSLDSSPTQRPISSTNSDVIIPTEMEQPKTEEERPAVNGPVMTKQVVSMPAPKAVTTPDEAGRSSSLKISMADKSSFGRADTNLVQMSLGIPADAVPRHCTIAGIGMARGDKSPGIYSFNAGSSDSILNYNGELTEISVTVSALCDDKTPLPENAKFIMKFGDKYSITLAQVNCKLPPAKAQRLLFRYSGDNAGECLYK